MPDGPPYVPSLPAGDEEGQRSVVELSHLQGAHGKELKPDRKAVDRDDGAPVHERGVQRSTLAPRVEQAQRGTMQVQGNPLNHL